MFSKTCNIQRGELQHFRNSLRVWDQVHINMPADNHNSDFRTLAMSAKALAHCFEFRPMYALIFLLFLDHTSLYPKGWSNSHNFNNQFPVSCLHLILDVIIQLLFCRTVCTTTSIIRASDLSSICTFWTHKIASGLVYSLCQITC